MSRANFNKFTMSEKINIFKHFEIDYLLMDYVFSDESENFVTPCEPDLSEDVIIRLRTYIHNGDSVFIYINGQRFPMVFSENTDIFSYYVYNIPAIFEPISYYFIISKNGREYYYNKKGLSENVDVHYNFKVIPGFKTPDWAKGAVMYQIYVDRFYNGDLSNDVLNNEYAYLSLAAKGIKNWNEPVAAEDVCNFYGGDLQGVMEKLPYLKDLGIEVIFFNPIFVSPSNHKYDIQDYDYVDPHYGKIVDDGGECLSLNQFHNKYATKYIQRTTSLKNLEASNALLIQLIEKAHENGIKVILDGVFNHCGSFNKWMDKEYFYQKAHYPVGAYGDKHSIYHDYFIWYDENWPNNDCYDAWWGHLNHPKLNFENSAELYSKIMEIGKKWVSEPFNADGWRLDVAADLGQSQEFNHKFWRDFRSAVKSVNKEAIILAEHYGDPSSWLHGDQWDTIMNYDAFMEPISWFLTGMEKHSDAFKPELISDAMYFEETMRFNMSRFTAQSLMTAMNQLSNHDHSRFLTRTNHKTGRLSALGHSAAGEDLNISILYEAVLFQMTWPGAPAIYYGDEAGLTGFTDPDNRRTYPWGMENKNLIAFHKALIKIRKENTALRTGSTEYLYNNKGILSFCRFNKSNKIAVILNNNNYEEEISLPIWKSEAPLNSLCQQLIYAYNGAFHTDNMIYEAVNGHIKIKMRPFSAAILKMIYSE